MRAAYRALRTRSDERVERVIHIKAYFLLLSNSYLFYVEGAVTVGMAAVILFILPNFPSDARFLTAEERLIAVRRLAEDTGEADEDEPEPWIRKYPIR